MTASIPGLETRDRRGPRHVLVSYQASVDGRAALAHAHAIARAAGAPLTVLALAPHEPVVGCARCRQSAVLWNRELSEIANEELAEAVRLLGPSPLVDYQVARGASALGIADAASRCGADLIVLPWQRPGRLRRVRARSLEERLRRQGSWQVVMAPPASRAGGAIEPAAISEPHGGATRS